MRLLKRLAKELKFWVGGVRSRDHQERSSAGDPAEDSVKPRDFEFLLSKLDAAPPLPGVSLVAACMNREENLMKVLGSWLSTDADEIVIVDWSSAFELWPKLSAISDPRIKVIRIDGEKQWIAAHALNVGLRFASHELVYRVDCDIELSQDFLKINSFQCGEFVRGFWKSGVEHGGEGQEFIHGTFGAYKKDLRKVNYYDERILTYGWEDSDLYIRLSHDLGLAGRLIDPNTLQHIEQTHEQRTANQSVSRNRFLGRWEPAEFEGATNKYYTAISTDWNPSAPLQDYGISTGQPRFYRGARVTEAPKRNAEIYRLSKVLAARDLAVWAFSTMKKVVSSIDEIDVNLANLLKDAHELNKSRDLVKAISVGKGLYFIRCEAGPYSAALHKTLQVMRKHYPSFAESLFLTESPVDNAREGGPVDRAENVLSAPRELLDKLSDRAGAKEIKHIGDLEELLESDNRKAHCLSLSARSLATEAIRKATRFSEKLAGEYEILTGPVPGSCLVTSLYDEQNLLRLIEYLACVVTNLRVFKRIVIYYEATNGLFAGLLHSISEELAIPPGRLLLVPFQKRPTFEELFSVQSLLPDGTVIAVANADIAFDASFLKVKEVDLSRNIVILSRRDISRDGRRASLIRLESGLPNTYSSDAWIASTPFEPDFFLDYLIGTMQCDSFINHQVSKSARYGAINPCLDIRIFHLHDDRFNSSEEKAKRDGEAIKQNNNYERARNGGEDPVKGVAWTTLAGAAIVPGAIQFQNWIPKVLILNFGKCSGLSFGHLLILHYLLFETIRHPTVGDVLVWIRLRETDREGVLAALLARLQTHLSCKNFLLDFDHDDFDERQTSAEDVVSRIISFDTVVHWITKGPLDKLYEFLVWPSIKELTSLRCEIEGDMSTEATVNLLSTLQRKKEPSLKSLLEFFNGLLDYSAQKTMLTPFIVPHLQAAPVDKGSQTEVTKRPSVSFVTSLFKGGEFLPGYLENVLAAAREAEGEVIIIDANVDDHDSRIVKDFLDKHPGARNIIDYVRLDHDPGLYECWKIGIERARADLITNANIDDRRCPSHTLRLVHILNRYPEYAGACGSISCVKSGGTESWFALVENELWFYNEPIKEIGFADLYRINESGEVMSRDVMHCMPVWRKSLHERYGYFDEESYGTSADWAFWLKCAKAGERFIFDRTAFGRYYLNPESHNRRNDPDGIKERRIIKDFIGIEQSGFLKQ